MDQLTRVEKRDAILDVDAAVRRRYSAAAQQPEAALCCAVDYDRRYLAALPEEIIRRDYGCGDPSRHLRPGETVLDLGCGGGKICYIASQVVGPQGRVLGVDANDDMLALARRHQAETARRIGHDNVRFLKGRIQDLALDLDEFERYLAEHPVRNGADWLAAMSHADELRRARPLIADAAVDVVISNCVLNLVAADDRRRLFAEMFRVLRPGGHAAISDITSDRLPPAELRNDPQLWSGCISGAFTEGGFLKAFEQAGFGPLEIVDRQRDPWTVVAGIEFRSLTVAAYKPPTAAEGNASGEVIYRGPWRRVTDDAGRTYERGARTEVDAARFAALSSAPYAGNFLAVGNTATPPEAAPSADALLAGAACCGGMACGD